MSITLGQILNLVGRLDDTPGEDTARERFRRYLQENVKEVGQVRDYIEGCLRKTGDQYSRALQDLVNYLGQLLEFEVTFGRYHGVTGKIGFDGHWASPTAFHMVVEVKTTEAYAIKVATLVGYVDGLISDRRVPNWESALGLYVVGRPDPEIRQLENAIIAEGRTHQLRVISVESLLSLSEMMHEYDVTHQDILDVLRPSGPSIDAVVDLMSRLVAQEVGPKEPVAEPLLGEPPPDEGEPEYWVTPVKGDADSTAEEVVQTLVGEAGVYAWASRTPGRKYLKPGDWLCFYATGKGVIAHARVSSRPEQRTHPKVKDSDKYQWVFGLDDPTLYLGDPVVIDAELRDRLDAFKGRDRSAAWSWFVQATRKLSRQDFKVLTCGSQSASS